MEDSVRSGRRSLEGSEVILGGKVASQLYN